MSRTNKFIKYLLRAIIILVSVVLLLFLLLNLPPVQNWFTEKATQYIEQKTNTKVSIGKLNLRLPNALLIEDLYLEDPERDTLLYLGRLKTGFSLTGLLAKRIEITGLQLRDVNAEVHPLRDGVMNYQFLLDALGSANPTDTVAKQENTPEGDGWTVFLSGAAVELENIHAYYLQPDDALEMSLDLHELNIDSREVDLKEGLIDLKAIELRRTAMSMRLEETEASPDTTVSTAHFQISSDEILIEEVDYSLELPELHLEAGVGYVQGKSTALQMAPDTMIIQSPSFDLQRGTFNYDVPGEPSIRGFDYNHMGLDSIAVSLRDFEYNNLDIRGQIEQARAFDKSGIALTGFKSRVHYTLDSIRIWDLEATTQQSSIRAPAAFVSFPFIDGAGELSDMRLEVDINQAFIQPEEITYFVPMLLDYPVFQQSFAKRLSLTTEVNGTLGDLRLDRFDLRGWNSQISANGRLRQVLAPEQMRLNLDVPVLQIEQAALNTWMPADVLTDGIQLPKEIGGQLRIEGSTQEMNIAIDLQTRRALNTVATRLRTSGVARQLLSPTELGYDFQIDTLYTTREEIQALVPPQSFPENVEIPEDALLRGQIRGTMDTLVTDLHLTLRRDTTENRIHASGSIDNFQVPEQAYFDILLDSLELKPALISSFLPDTLLPDYLRLPAIESGSLSLRGTMKNLKSGLRLQTSIGRIETEGSLQDSTYNLQANFQNFDPEALFKPAAYDSIIGRDLSRLNLELALEGTGFDPDSNLNAQVDLRILPQSESLNWDTGVVINGRIRGKSFYGTIDVREPGLQAALQAEAGVNSEDQFFTDLQLDLEELNLKKLQLRDTIFIVNGRLKAQSTGSHPENFRAKAELRSVDFLYDTIRQRMDSLLVDIDFRSDTNIVELRSDIARGYLRGRFDYPQVTQHIRNYLRSYIDPTFQDTLLTDTAYAAFDLQLELTRPDVLTSGLIKGLQEMNPSSISGAFNTREERLELEAKIPHVKYTGIVFDSLYADLKLGQDSFRYKAGFANMVAFEEIRSSKLAINGRQEGERFVNHLVQRDDDGKLRFDIVAAVQPDQENVSLHFQPKAIFNYNEWQFSSDNRLLIGGDTLVVSNWQLGRESSRLSLSEQEGRDLIATFDQFDLSLLSNTIKYNSDYLSGLLNGTLSLNNIIGQPLIAADIAIDDFAVLKAGLGRMESKLEQSGKDGWEGQFDFEGSGHDFTVQGAYYPGEDTTGIDFLLDAQRIDLAQLENLMEGYAEDLQGTLNGNIEIGGTLEVPDIKGQLQFESAALRLTQYQALWNIGSEPINIQRLSRNGKSMPVATFDQLTLTDKDGDKFSIDGEVRMASLDDIDLDLGFSANSFLVLNSSEQDNDLYYGNLEVNADGSLRGAPDAATLILNVTTTGDSRVVYKLPVDAIQTVETGEGVIEFVAPDTLTQIALNNRREASPSSSNPFGWAITLNAAVNNELQLKIVTNSLTGDHFQGKADGDLALQINPRGEMNLSGRIRILEGSYLFTYSDIIKREFEVLEGSYLQWTSDVMNPELFIKAQYTTRTSPAPIMPVAGENMPPAFKRRQEFDVIFTIAGEPDDLQIETEIEYPETSFNTSNSEIALAVDEVNQNPSTVNSQAFSLLLFNGFMNPNMAGSSDAQLINVNQGLNDLLTTYLNDFANQYIKFVDINFDIASTGGNESGYFESTDFRVSLQKSFLDNRLTVSVDGVASSRETGSTGNTDEMQTYLDNITVEYALTQEGVLNIRLYNRREMSDFFGGEVVKMGAALGFSKDFERLRLFSGKHDKQKNKSPEEEKAPAEERENAGDSNKKGKEE